ncbi:MAG TPA: universal stress protein [Anaerolineales bacterium]|nr:universal stress protein [Anaerolineales bacterium]
MYRQILLALEGKPTDEAAFAHAVDLAQRFSSRLTLLQVVAIAADEGDGMVRNLQLEPGASGWRRINRALANLAAYRERLRKSGLEIETGLVVGERSEADEVVDFVQAGRYDLIVLASDGRSWWRRAISGSLADGVHRKATVPTLLVSDGTRRQRIRKRQRPAWNTGLRAFSRIHPC